MSPRSSTEGASEAISIAALNRNLKGNRVTLVLRDGRSYDTFAPEVASDSTYFGVVDSEGDSVRAVATPEVERLIWHPSATAPLKGGAVGVMLGGIALFLAGRQANRCEADNCVGAALSVSYATLAIPVLGLLGLGAGALQGDIVYQVIMGSDGEVRIVR